MPDVTCTMRGPDVDPEIILDETTIGEGMSAYVQQLATVWTRRFREQHHAEPRALSREAREAILEWLRGDFDATVAPDPRRVAEEELVRLTAQQGDYLARLEENPRVLVRGGAGTGKTMLALEEASRAARSGERVLFPVLQPATRRVPSSRNPPEGVTIFTLHSLMSSLIKHAGLERELPDADESDLYEVFFPC